MILTKSGLAPVNLEKIIAERIKNKSLDSFLLIVPTNRKSRFQKKEIISSAPGQSSGRINIETIGTYSTKIFFDDISARGRILTEATSAVLLKQAFTDTELKYFSSYKNGIPSGTVERIKNVINEYKKHGITPGHLREELKKIDGSEKIKAEDIANVYQVYQEKCVKLNVMEIGDIYAAVNSLNDDDFAVKFKELYPHVNLIIINGFDEFTAPEVEIIDKTSVLPETCLHIGFDYYSHNNFIFSHLDECYNRLLKRKFTEVQDISPPVLDAFNRTVREELFNMNNNHPEYKPKINIITATDRSMEIELIAKEIKELISNQNVEPHKICVVFNLIHHYSHIVRDIFTLHGIPFNLTDRYSLTTSQPVIAIINFLEILENDFYYKNIFRALTGGFIKLHSVDLSNLLRASVNLKIISGFSNWNLQLNEALQKTLVEDDDSVKRYEKRVYEKAFADIENIHTILKPFVGKLTLREFQKNLTDLIFSLNIPLNILNSHGDEVEKNTKALSSFMGTVNEMLELFKLEYGTEKQFPLSYYLDNLRTAVTATRYNIKEKPDFGVQVTTLNEIRGLKFDYLFISGLCDGDLPTRYQPEIFFSGSYVRKESKHQTEERYHFYQTLCAWNEKLYLTYPLREDKKELARSNFLTEFISLFDTNAKDKMDYEHSVYSINELLHLFGINQSEDIKAALKGKIIDADFISNSIAVNKERISNPEAESAFSGVISKALNEDEKLKLSEMKEKEFSISQLENYAKCPYKYFAERILKLEPPEEPTEEIEALEMGSLLHNILFEFYVKIKEEGIILAGADEKIIDRAEEIIFSIAEEKLSNTNCTSPINFFEKEKILGVNGDHKKSILYLFLLEEQKSEDGFIPEYFEISFGGIKKDASGTDSLLTELSAGEVKVRGKIDRVDINQPNKKFRVVDYKLSGKKPTLDDLKRGISLQLPLYMYAAKKLIKAQFNYDADPSSAEIYSLKFNQKSFGKIIIKPTTSRTQLDENELEALNQKIISECVEAINNYVKLILEGKFNLSRLHDRENKVCRYCSFRAVCRIQDIN